MKKPASKAAAAKSAAPDMSRTATAKAATPRSDAARAGSPKAQMPGGQTAKASPTGIVKTSKIDLSSNTKSEIAGILNARLADGIDLALITKQAHWNLKGPGFIGIHLMLDGFRDELDVHVDTIAERIAQLGGIALGTSQTTAATTTLAPYPTGIVSIQDHLNALIERYAATANAVREAIDAAEEAGDAGTADMLTAYSRTLDKSLWFLQSNLG
jgi:starvation-inducible DNA-binding protein